MQGQRLLITGATGILGGWVVADALRRGHRPVALLRDPNMERARERIEAVVTLAGLPREAARSVEIVLGDVRRHELGLAPETRDGLRDGLDGVIHCAASVSFSQKHGQHTWDTNVNGLLHVLGIFARTDIPLYHVSTAYVAGKTPGRFHEGDLDRGQDFHNAYERSKFECERVMRDAFNSGAVRGAIFRPAIITGAARDGAIATFYNFYGFLRLIDAAMNGGMPFEGQVRLPLNCDCTKNLIPVDWCADAMLEVIERRGPSNATYNLTNPDPVRQGDLVAMANAMLAERNIEIVLDAAMDAGSATPIEQMTNYLLRHYGEYLEEEPIFDRGNLDAALEEAAPFPEMDLGFYLRLLEYARNREWRGLFETPSESEKASKRDASAAETLIAAELSGNAVFG